MRTNLRFWIVPVASMLVPYLVSAAETAESAGEDLVAVTHPTEGYTVMMPADWETNPLGPTLMGLSSQTNFSGGNSGNVMVAPSPAGRAFDELVQKAEEGTENTEQSGVRNEVRFVTHPQGQAVLVYQYVDRTETKGATYSYNIKIGETVWVVNCTATDTEEAIQPIVAVCEQVGSTFRAARGDGGTQ